MSDDFVLLEKEGAVAILRLNRPDVLNALNIPTMDRLITLMESLDGDPSVHCMVLTGSDKAFAAGADIKEMTEASVMDMYERNNLARWERIKRVRTPIVAAVSGFCLGGGCELAMHCDIITASETAKFGQPEINIGVMPGAGGTQRLSKVVGKYRAMELILTGRFFDASEALRLGLVTHVWPVESYLKETLALAHQIAEKSPVATRVAKEAVLRAFETGLSDGLEYERKLFYMLFATEDQKEGMKAFVEKRKPKYTGR